MPADGAECGHHAVAAIEQYRAQFDLNEEWLGILVEPWWSDEYGAPQVQVNVRTVDGPYASTPGLDAETERRQGYRYDLAYTFDGERMAAVIDDIYPAMVAEIEDAFPTAQLEYDRPYVEE